MFLFGLFFTVLVHCVNICKAGNPASDCAHVYLDSWSLIGPAQAASDCKSKCATNDSKWQWSLVQDANCYCTDLLDKGVQF
jgi:hypothetical protein